MSTLPAFWHAAAALSGRLDLSPLLAAGLSPGAIETLPPDRLVALGLRLDQAARLASCRPLGEVGPFVTLADASFPRTLATTPFAPPVLFYRGNLALLGEPAVAVVGCRRCTESGKRMARRISQAVVAAGGVVVSGLAWGIDAAAHRAAHGRTVAVLGQGLAEPLSPHQQLVADELLDQGGLLVSEFLPRVRPSRYTFPQRNRVVAGLARLTVVVEAGHRSGALITARHAAELGRDVMAVPGHPLDPSFAGCLRLIADGAALVTTAGDVVEAAGLQPAPPGCPAPAAPLLAALGAGRSLDDLTEDTGRSVVDLTRALAALELAGLVERLPGDRYAQRPLS